MPPEPLLDPLELLLADRPGEAVAAFRAQLAFGDAGPSVTASLAVALSASGETDLHDALDAVRSAARRGTREERHRAEVIVLALTGRRDRATGLGREHLVDHPDDRLVRHVLARWCAGGDDHRRA
jgi:hypothetical protein